MNTERIVSSRPDREIRKRIITHGDYDIVPYEDSRCKILISDITCKNDGGDCEVEAESRIFSGSFNGIVIIGDNDCFIDRDFELILQQMCSGETCSCTMLYKNAEGKLVKEISCSINLLEVTEEQLISDWSWQRLYEAALYHKECGVELIKQKRVIDAFRRFNKSLKMVIAIEPIDSKVIEIEYVNNIIELKAKLYNNLAHCQLQYNEYDAALKLCNRALSYDPANIKSLYRRCLAYSGLNMYQEAWKDIQQVLSIDPNDNTAQHRANLLRPKIGELNQNYNNVIKKMFS